LELASKYASKISNTQLKHNGNQMVLMKSMFSLKQGMAFDLARDWKQ